MPTSWYAFVVAILVMFGHSPTKHSWIETIDNMKRSIVPVACGYVDENGKWIIADIEGIGFFIDHQGKFVTASHVLDGLDTFLKTAKHKCIPAIYIPDDGWSKFTNVINLQYFNFTQCIRLISADVAVCTPQENPFTSQRVAKGIIQEVSFDTKGVPDGTPIAFSGFPLQDTSPLTSVGDVAGRAISTAADPWFFYMIDKTAWPGASGSPMYTEDGKVIGIILGMGTEKSAGIGLARCSAAIVDFLSKAPALNQQQSSPEKH